MLDRIIKEILDTLLAFLGLIFYKNYEYQASFNI